MTLSLPPSRFAVPAQDNPLAALERAWRHVADGHALVRRGGRVTEVSPTHFRVRGLSDVARLGDMVEHRSRAGLRHGEIVQISPDEVLVSPFER
ncbi:MAG: flagellum-specific ATP synthase FliI, partial [Pseudomonadota bacterium]|nr:flagellum-specific ATP synthase FliI [Pseudomonadota bacterium]